ncbi:MAG: PAS domain-containing protein [Kiritimatiellae bacterium]|nr:PAS domain-containing protein [Kiritimatiellia bacterium]
MSENNHSRLSKSYLIGLILSCVFVLAAGVWQMSRIANLADQYAREKLLMTAASLTQTITPEVITALSFSEADRQNPLFQRLNRQFAAASEHLGLAGVFTVIRREGQFVFGPGSCHEGEGIRKDSMPGTPYFKPPPQMANAFVTCQPQVTPFYSDEYGTFISVFVPIIEPQTGEAVLTVGIDLHVKQWQRLIRYARNVPLFFTLLILFLLATGFSAIALRTRLSEPSRWRLRYAEAFLCAAVMLTLTVATVWRVWFGETHGRETSFAALAQQQASSITQELCGMQSRLGSLRQMFKANGNVSREAFASYAASFTSDYAVQAALWAPAVASNAVTRFEAETRASGLPDYRVWQTREQGMRVPATGRPVFYPVRYIEPQNRYGQALGYDLGSESVRTAALQKALRTSLMTATSPEKIFSLTNHPFGFLAIHATAAQTQTGVVAIAIRADSLVSIPMYRALPSQGLTTDLFQLTDRQTPLFLATSAHSHPTDPPCWTEHDEGLHFKAPIFVFGRTYAVVIHVSPAWLSAHTLRDTTTVAIAGLLLSTLLTAFVVFLSNRRIALEREVGNRIAELKVARDNLQNILSAAPVAMMVVDRDTRILTANGRAEHLFQSHACDCMNRECGVFLNCAHRHNDPRGCGYSRDCANCPLRRAISSVADGGANVYDCHMETHVESAGKTKTFHLRFSVAPVLINNRQRIIVAIHDITSWYRTEQLYQTLFSEMHYGFTLSELIIGGQQNPIDFEWRAANPACERITGIPVKFLKGKTVLKTFPDFPPDLIAAYTRVVQTGEASHFSFFFPNLGKHLEGTLFRPAPGQVACIFDDVTDRKRIEEQARSSAEETNRLLNETRAAQHDLMIAVEEQKCADEALIHERNLLYALMDNLPDRIYFKDTESRFQKISKAHAVSLGLASPEDAVGKTDADFKPANEAERTRATEQAIIKTGQPLLGQVEQKQTADGKTQWVSASKAPIKDQAGRVVGIVGISRDITHEIELQQQLQQASKMDAIGRLAGGVAHDFNNLLQAILGFTEILIAGVCEQDPQYDDLKQIERAAKRAADLTHQLLAFSRKQLVQPQVLDLNHIIVSTEKMLRRLLGEDIEIVQLLDPNTQPICADPNQIEQIIINLAVNSRDAIQNGGRISFTTGTVELTSADIDMIPESLTGTFTCLSVSDTGTGISQEQLSHLFEPFFTTKSQGKGTGLGLSVIYGIVKQNGGWINVYSQLGQGTTFKVYLPVYQSSGTSSPLTRHAPDTPPPPPETLPGLGKTILLVEDEIGVRSLATLVLQSSGFKVTACEDAQSAKTVFTRTPNQFDLLFSDVVLPGQNGIELAIELHGMRPELPVLLCSGYADDRVRWASIEKEGFRFITKPYPTATLLRAVHEALQTVKKA